MAALVTSSDRWLKPLEVITIDDLQRAGACSDGIAAAMRRWRGRVPAAVTVEQALAVEPSHRALILDAGQRDGNGNGYGDGDGYYGDGDLDGYGDGNGYYGNGGYGYGYYGDGYGDGAKIDGYGYGYGYYGNGNGNGNGDSYGTCYGNGYGYGDGYGDGGL